jgi:DNA adenine methylase
VASAPVTDASSVKPLLKWAGGKRQLLPELRRFYPAVFGAYIEPFLGSGAVFFDLHQRGALDGRPVFLIDSNPDLIGCYEVVRDRPDAVADALEALAARHASDVRGHYYEVRDRAFNPQREARRTDAGRIAYTPELAAMLIYLNRTGFNGLFRVNSRGAFNVPAGRYERPRIADRQRLHDVAAALAGDHVHVLWGSFLQAEAVAQPGDFLYFDPPYAPLSRTAAFTSYTHPRFGALEQAALQEMAIRLSAKSCHVLLSNSTADEIRALYDGNPAAAAAGLHAYRVPARRAINSKAASRGAIDEYVITNLPRRAG